jgi:DNA-3-methyladenine glycosylase I
MKQASPEETREIIRCGWAGGKPHLIAYHDEEWGIPVHDDRRHFEMLILEGAQAGLSWSTILLRREGYRRAFAGFDPIIVSNFDTRTQAALLKDSGIIRNRLKIQSAVTNARAFLKVQEAFGSFDAYIWQFVGGTPRMNHWADMSQVPATTPESDALSKDLKKRGFRFVGSTVMYAHMQAAGLVNDHTIDCFRHPSHAFTFEPASQATALPAIKLKRVYDPPSPEDGLRILVDRLWPRGLAKASARIDLWLKDLAPSTALRTWFRHDPARWQEFRRRYFKELDRQQDAGRELWETAQTKPVTLVYGAQHSTHNNAVVLKDYLVRHAARFT